MVSYPTCTKNLKRSLILIYNTITEITKPAWTLFNLRKGRNFKRNLIQRLLRDYLDFFHQPPKQIDLQSWIGMLIRLVEWMLSNNFP